jgi:hypothetical protein
MLQLLVQLQRPQLHLLLPLNLLLLPPQPQRLQLLLSKIKTEEPTIKLYSSFSRQILH